MSVEVWKVCCIKRVEVELVAEATLRIVVVEEVHITTGKLIHKTSSKSFYLVVPGTSNRSSSNISDRGNQAKPK